MNSIFQILKYSFASLVFLFLLGCASEMKKGSDKTMYTIADTMKVVREDIGKNIQLRLDQKLLFNFEGDPQNPGKWEVLEYDRRTLILLNETPWTAPGVWGHLFRANALGSGYIKLRFSPAGENTVPQDVSFDIDIRR